jgi:hypothetical protein
MDNGLIFPYRRKTANTEPVILTAQTVHVCPSGPVCAGRAGPDPGR